MPGRFSPRNVFVILFALAVVSGCEQVLVNGPLGGAAVTVTELRSGKVISADTVVTDDLDMARARWGEGFDDFSAFQFSTVLGIALLNTLPVEPDTWYLVSVEGGFDYDGYPDLSPMPVAGTVHALMTGEQLSSGGFIIGPLSEGAWQWVQPWLNSMDDADLRAALDEYSAPLVDDIHEPGQQRDYVDLLKYHPVLHPGAFLGSETALDAMRSALTDGSSDAVKLGIVQNLVATAVPRAAAEAVFRDNISPNISQAICIQCHVAGGVAGATRHRLVRTSTANHIATNVQMYADLVDAIGVSQILSKAQGGSNHGGGTRLSPGSLQAQDFQAFLEML